MYVLLLFYIIHYFIVILIYNHTTLQIVQAYKQAQQTWMF